MLPDQRLSTHYLMLQELTKKPDSIRTRDAIFDLEKHMNPVGQEITHSHRFAPGVYTREMFVPAGMMITGKIHKTEHISIFLSGRMLVTDGFGKSKEIVAPMVENALPGVKRAGIALEDVRWITIHPTEETDLDVLEDMLVTNDFSEVEHLVDQQDYIDFELEYGVTDDTKKSLSKIEVQKMSVDGIEIRGSKRHGLGVFATTGFMAGEELAPAVINGELFKFARYTNHSMNPNAKMQSRDGRTNIVAIRDIYNEEITVDYRDTINGAIE